MFQAHPEINLGHMIMHGILYHYNSLVPRLLPVFQCYTQKNGGAWYLIARDLCVQERPNSLAFSKRGDRHS